MSTPLPPFSALPHPEQMQLSIARTDEFQALLDETWLQFRTWIVDEHHRAMCSGWESAAARPSREDTAASQRMVGGAVQPACALGDVLCAAREETSDFKGGAVQDDRLNMPEHVSPPFTLAKADTLITDTPEDPQERWELIVYMILEDSRGYRIGSHNLHRDWTTAEITLGGGSRSSLSSVVTAPSRKPLKRKGARTFRDSLQSESVSSEFTVVISPTSKLNLAWMLLLLVFISYDIIWAPVELAFGNQLEEPTLLLFGSVAFWSLDMLMNFVTGIYVDGIMITKLREIARNYIKTWFVLDFTILLFEYIQLLVGLTSLGIAAVRFMKLSKLSRVLRILKVFRAFEYLHSASSEALKVLAQFVLMNLLYMIGLHVSACCWIRLQYLALTGHFLRYVENDPMQTYLISLSDMICFLVGSTVDVAIGHEHYVFAVIFKFVGFSSCAIYTARILEIFKRFDAKTFRKLQSACDGFLRRHDIPRDLQVSVRRSLLQSWRYTQLKDSVAHNAELVKNLPAALYKDICVAAYGPRLRTCTFFSQLDGSYPGVNRLICFDALSDMVFQARSVIFTRGYESKSMYFVTEGRGLYTQSRAFSNGRTSFFDDVRKDRILKSGVFLCEMSLWLKWNHVGNALMETDSVVLALNADKFREIVKRFQDVFLSCLRYGKKFLYHCNMNAMTISDASHINLDWHDLHMWHLEKQAGYWMFLCHFKEEVGSDAALMHSDIMRLRPLRDSQNPLNSYKTPVFLDSEYLQDLGMLKDHVAQSQNLLVLLSPSVLQRPWCLIEIVTARQFGINITPVLIDRPGMTFTFPDDMFYNKLRSGKYLDANACEILAANGIKLDEVENAIRHVFKKIALKFRPHEAAFIRLSEVSQLEIHMQTKNVDGTESASGISKRHSMAIPQTPSFGNRDSCASWTSINRVASLMPEAVDEA